MIDDISCKDFYGYVGKTYHITTRNSSKCDLSKLLVTSSKNYSSVVVEDLISIQDDGTLKIVGVGKCEVWIRSATNERDDGVKLKIHSSIKNELTRNAVNDLA